MSKRANVGKRVSPMEIAAKKRAHELGEYCIEHHIQGFSAPIRELGTVKWTVHRGPLEPKNDVLNVVFVKFGGQHLELYIQVAKASTNLEAVAQNSGYSIRRYLYLNGYKIADFSEIAQDYINDFNILPEKYLQELANITNHSVYQFHYDPLRFKGLVQTIATFHPVIKTV